MELWLHAVGENSVGPVPPRSEELLLLDVLRRDAAIQPPLPLAVDELLLTQLLPARKHVLRCARQQLSPTVCCTRRRQPANAAGRRDPSPGAGRFFNDFPLARPFSIKNARSAQKPEKFIQTKSAAHALLPGETTFPAAKHGRLFAACRE
jgi:hypothetical protein